jgi:hypothetical protein
MTRGKFQLTATRGGIAVLRRGFDDRDEADKAVADALVRYCCCEVRLTESGTALLWAGPARIANEGIKKSW